MSWKFKRRFPTNGSNQSIEILQGLRHHHVKQKTGQKTSPLSKILMKVPKPLRVQTKPKALCISQTPGCCCKMQEEVSRLHSFRDFLRSGGCLPIPSSTTFHAPPKGVNARRGALTLKKSKGNWKLKSIIITFPTTRHQ